MRTVTERESLWQPGSGIVDLPGAERGGSDPTLRPIASADDLPPAFAEDPPRAVEELAASSEQRPALVRRVFDLRLGSWQVLCPIGPDSVIVDLDAGFGAAARSLARVARLVIGVDDVRGRLLVADAVNRAQAVENVRLACGDFRVIQAWPDAFLDGVALGRRLAEVGGRGPGGHGERVAFLSHVRRTLREHGWVQIAAKNGNGLRRLTRRRCPPYPGIAGLVGMLQEAGFGEVSAFAVAPDHEQGHLLVPCTPDGDLDSALRASGTRGAWKLALLGSGVLRPFVPWDLLLVARVPKARVPVCLKRESGALLPLRRIQLESERANLWYRGGRSERIREVTLEPASDGASDRLAAVAAAWDGRDDAPEYFADWRRDAGDGRHWMDRRKVQGRPVANSTDEVRDGRLRIVCRRLREIAALGPSVSLPILDRTEAVRHFLSASVARARRPEDGLEDRLCRVADALSDRYPGGPALLMHGDFAPKNVLVHARRVEPIEWNLATVVDFPGYDMMRLLWHRHCGRSPERGFWVGVVEECAAGRADERAARWIREACGPVDPVGVLATFWLLRATRGVGFGSDWMDEHALPSLERAEAWLGITK